MMLIQSNERKEHHTYGLVTGNLDSQNSSEVLALLKETARQYEQTVIMITQNAWQFRSGKWRQPCNRYDLLGRSEWKPPDSA